MTREEKVEEINKVCSEISCIICPYEEYGICETEMMSDNEIDEMYDAMCNAKMVGKEEAIELLQNIESTGGRFSDRQREAVQMAIEALKENESLAKSVNDAAELIHKLQKKNELIPCSERLPEYDKYVLCYTDAEEFIVGYRVDNWGQDAWITGEFGDGEFNAIAWMPLPEPYTEARDV